MMVLMPCLSGPITYASGGGGVVTFRANREYCATRVRAPRPSNVHAAGCVSRRCRRLCARFAGLRAQQAASQCAGFRVDGSRASASGRGTGMPRPLVRRGGGCGCAARVSRRRRTCVSGSTSYTSASPSAASSSTESPHFAGMASRAELRDAAEARRRKTSAPGRALVFGQAPGPVSTPKTRAPCAMSQARVHGRGVRREQAGAAAGGARGCLRAAPYLAGALSRSRLRARAPRATTAARSARRK